MPYSRVFWAAPRTESTFRVGAVIPESLPEDARRRQTELTDERDQCRLFGLDEVRPGLGVLAGQKSVPDRPHPAADTTARLDERDGRAILFERSRGSQAGKAGAGDDDMSPTKAR